MSTASEAVVERYVGAYNDRDVDALVDILADPFTFNGDALSRDDFLGLVRGYWEAFPDLELELTHRLATDDYVLVRHQFDATGVGEYYGHDVDGKTVESTEMTLFHVSDGEIDEYWYAWDELGFWVQLGVLDDPYAEV